MRPVTTRVTRRAPNGALRVREGYDLAATAFLAWHWTKFWQYNEAPLVRRWLNELHPGFGLDAGAGVGPYLGDATRAGHRCMALDVSMKMLAKARAPRRSCLAWRVQSDIHDLPIKDGRLDWVLTTRVLSNNADPGRILDEFARATRGGASCLITDVHPDHPYEQTSITAGGRVLEIETHRHDVAWIRVLASRSFKVTACINYGLDDLFQRPSRSLFRKLYDNSSVPIFYVMALERK